MSFINSLLNIGGDAITGNWGNAVEQIGGLFSGGGNGGGSNGGGGTSSPSVNYRVDLLKTSDGSMFYLGNDHLWHGFKSWSDFIGWGSRIGFGAADVNPAPQDYPSGSSRGKDMNSYSASLPSNSPAYEFGVPYSGSTSDVHVTVDDHGTGRGVASQVMKNGKDMWIAICAGVVILLTAVVLIFRKRKKRG